MPPMRTNQKIIRLTKIKVRPPIKLTHTQNRLTSKIPINNNPTLNPVPVTIKQLPTINKPVPLIIT